MLEVVQVGQYVAIIAGLALIASAAFVLIKYRPSPRSNLVYAVLGVICLAIAALGQVSFDFAVLLAKIGAVEDKVQGLQDQMTALEAADKQLGERQSEAAGRLDAQAETLDALSSRVEVAEQGLEAMGKKIDDARKSIKQSGPGPKSLKPPKSVRDPTKPFYRWSQ
ncbi:MAG: hypothetical protein QF893_18455 [Alphaproteobacteria bacterium]|jgi:hypothetical protein|nr:hypothetical protein [Alphaproteobacteria bacterium]